MESSSQIEPKEIGKARSTRGRPAGTFRTPPDLLQDIWLHLEEARARHELATGKRLSVLKTCRRIEAGGGLHWIVGGDREAIFEAMKTPGSSLSRARRYRVDQTGGGLQVIPDRDGPIIATHSISHHPTLRARYAEANRLVRNDPMIRAAWSNMLNDRLGLPRRPLPRAGGK